MKRLLRFLAKSFFIPSIKFGALKWPTIQIPLMRLRLPSLAGHRLELKFPQVSINLGALKLPGSFMKVTATGMTFAAISIVVVLVFAIQGTNASPIFPEPAQYQVASVAPDQTLKVGEDWVVPETATLEERELMTNTLKINMSGARASNITINDVDIGATFGSATDTIKIIGATGKVLECETVILDNVTATKLTIDNSQFHTMNILNNQASGISIGGTLSSTPAAITVQSERGAVSIPSVGGGGSSFDKIEISTITASSQCKKLTISNVRAYGGGITINNLHAGTFTLQNSTFGADASLDTFELVISAATLYSTMTASNNVEKSIIVK
jgi:hypothetical protein